MGAYVIPAFQAEATIGLVVAGLRSAASEAEPIVVVDDGSTDDTAGRAEAAGAIVLRHAQNEGKGAALKTAFHWASAHGHDVVVSLDADGQHPPAEAARLMRLDASAGALVLGVRDLARAGAPLANRRSNAFSNLVLSWFGGRRLLDTQCGLRRYPVEKTLELRARAHGFAFESEVVLRAARRGMTIIHTPSEVLYPKDRTTHFDSWRDPARIVFCVVATWLLVPHHRRGRRALERTFCVLLILLVLAFSIHWGIDLASRMRPTDVAFDRPSRVDSGPLRKVGLSQALRRQGIWEVMLRGAPAQIGWAHSRLLHAEMTQTEGALQESFRRYVPTTLARTLLVDLARFTYRDVDRGMSSARLRELTAASAGFQPDPFSHFMPTYERFVYLSALYDISLSLEHSPLLGCTTFTVREGEEGGPLLARVFDFEVHDVFDREKAVFFVAEDGQIPFVSVAWPGLVGVVTGMNREGVALVVHGARGGEFVADGEPVVQAVRRVLGTAATTEEAIERFDEQPAMVSHIIVAQDSRGHAARFERVPGHDLEVISLRGRAAVSNHFEGHFSDDPRNLRVMRETSTLARRLRGDALIRALGEQPIAAATLAQFLRDRGDETGRELPHGDRRAIDADIATHAVIMDTKARTMWVNQGPHLRGEFVRYDLLADLERGSLPEPSAARPTLGQE